MKALKRIQLLSKIAEVVCRIIFIFCIIAVAGAAISLLVVGFAKNNVDFQNELGKRNITLTKVVCDSLVTLLSCGCGIYLSYYNEKLFKKEIKLGTPFDLGLVKDMRKVAIINIILCIALSIVVAIVVAIVKAINNSTEAVDYDVWTTVMFGIFLLIISLFCEYGASLLDKEDKIVLDAETKE